MAKTESLIGRQVGRYRILESAGRGGMARVYKAQIGKQGRIVALKALDLKQAVDPSVRKRFRREVKALKKLNHPHIVKYFDFLEVPAGDFLVLEYIDGNTLKDRLDNARRGRRKLPARTVVRIVQQTAAALDYAHRRGMVHRDVKPANILLDRQGNVHLSDFGLVYMPDASYHTSSGVIIGTPQYIAPEQAMASQSVAPPTDVYSLGICVYEMITNTLPFRGESTINVVLQHIQETVPSPRGIDRRIPVKVERVVMKSLKKDPRDRYATPKEFADALADVLLPKPGAVDTSPLTKFKPTAAKPRPAGRGASIKQAWNQRRSKTAKAAPAAKPSKMRRLVPWVAAIAGLGLLILGLGRLELTQGNLLAKANALAGSWARAWLPAQADGGQVQREVVAGLTVTPGQVRPPAPTAAVEFRMTSLRLLSAAEVSCQNLVPVFHLRALDAAGTPLDNIRLDVFWNEGRIPGLNSGWNAPGYVKATLSRGTFQAQVLSDVPPFGERTYTSDVTPPLSTVSPPIELLEAAGYCQSGLCQECATYSYEIVFQRQW